MDLRKIKVSAADDFGLMTYDPGFSNTASCHSRITQIDGEKGYPQLPWVPDRAAGGDRAPTWRPPT